MKKSGAKPMSNAGEVRPGERVYLLRARTLELAPGHSMCYPAGYYQLEPEQAAEWVRDGLAVPESEWEARLAEAAQAAAADPVMHPAGPLATGPFAPPPAGEPEGKMWPAGPKDAPKPAVAVSGANLDAAAEEEKARQAAGAQDSADVQTSANEETREPWA